MSKKICMLGDGAWGTAVSMLLADNGYAVTIWCKNSDVAHSINTTRYNNRYLPTIVLDEKIHATTDLHQAIDGATTIFEAVPVPFLRSVLVETKKHCSPEQIWVVLTKGIEQETLFFPSQIIDDVLGDTTKKLIFSGPSFAIDVAHKQITAVTLASHDCDIALQIQRLLSNHYFYPSISRDPIGVQVGGALKNIIAIGIGILEGAGYTDNTKAWLLTQALQEMAQLSSALGGKVETIYGLSGVGDLILTTMGKHSKNLALGYKLGQGISLSAIQKQQHSLPEGINSAESLDQLMKKYNLQLPIFSGIIEVIEGKPLKTMLSQLMVIMAGDECL